MKFLDRLRHCPIDQAAEPSSGEVIVNNFWLVDPDKGIAFYSRGKAAGSYVLDQFAPQCNRDKNVADILVKNYPGHIVQQVPAVYLNAAAPHLKHTDG